MRFGIFETLFIGLLLAGLVWVVYQIVRPPVTPDHEALKQELRDLRRRLAALSSIDKKPAEEENGEKNR